MINTFISLAAAKAWEEAATTIRYALADANPADKAGLTKALVMIEAERMAAAGHHDRMCDIANGRSR